MARSHGLYTRTVSARSGARQCNAWRHTGILSTVSMAPVHNYYQTGDGKETVRVYPFLGQYRVFWLKMSPRATSWGARLGQVPPGGRGQPDAHRGPSTRHRDSRESVGLAAGRLLLGYERLAARAVRPAMGPLIDTGEPRHRGAARVYLRHDNFDSGGLRPRLNVDREEPKSSTTPRAIHGTPRVASDPLPPPLDAEQRVTDGFTQQHGQEYPTLKYGDSHICV